MNFQEAESYLLSLGNEVETMKLGLENIRKLLVALGNPETNYLKVQIAGTNGKGSVCAFLDSICLQAGIKTGVFTSPHLMSITERVRIDGSDISENEFGRIASVVRATSERLVADGELDSVPTYFEQVTAIALVALREAKVDLAILETGLGGRYDATTAANAEICAITRIDLDHQEYLGESIEEIAAEKAAIIRADSTVVLSHQSRAVEQVMISRCREVNVEPKWATQDIETKLWEHVGYLAFTHTFRTDVRQYPKIDPLMHGRHQAENAAVAIAIAEVLGQTFPISEMEICLGLETATHPGRLEFFHDFLLDGAHNVAGAIALKAFLDDSISRPIVILFGAMSDKNVGGIAKVLFPLADKIVLTQPSNSRAMSAETLFQYLPENVGSECVFQTHSVAEAIQLSRDLVSTDGLILVTGSLYLVGEVRKILTGGAKPI